MTTAELCLEILQSNEPSQSEPSSHTYEHTPNVHTRTHTQPLYATNAEKRQYPFVLHAKMQKHVWTPIFLKSSVRQQPPTAAKQTSTAFNQVAASRADAGHRRCTFITASRKQPPLLPHPLSLCLDRPASKRPGAADAAVRGFFTAVHLAAPIGVLKAAQQKSMSIWLLLSQSLDGIFSWKNGLQSWSSKQINCMLEEQRQKDTSHTCSFSDPFALYSPSAITYNLVVVCVTKFFQRPDVVHLRLNSLTLLSHSVLLVSDLLYTLQINTYNTQQLAASRREVTDITQTGVCVMQNILYNASSS